MSLSLEGRNIELVHAIDPRVDINDIERRKYGVVSSGNDNNFYVWSSPSISNSSITWNANPLGGRKTFVARRAYKQITFQLQFFGASGGPGQALLQCAGLPHAAGVSVGNTFYDAPRCQPIANICMQESVNINGTLITQNTGQFFRGLTRFWNPPESQDSDMSMTPSMTDQAQNYGDLFGFARSPLRGYGDNFQQCPRGGFIGAFVTQNTSAGSGDQATVLLTVTEPLYCSPFVWGDRDDECSLIGVETMSVQLTLGGLGSGPFSGLISSLWSHDALSPSTFTNAIVTVNTANLLFNYITPDLPESIPRIVNYSYLEPYYLQTTINSSFPAYVPNSAGPTYQIVKSNTVTLISIPNRVYIWMSPSDTLYNWTSSDTYFGINQLQMQFENRPIVFSSATQQDLYQMARKNGLNLDYRQFSNDVGSILCVTFGPDYPLRPTQAPGTTGRYDFQVTVAAANLNQSISYTSVSLNVLVISEGTFTLGDGGAVKVLGPLTEVDVLDAKRTVPVKYYQPRGPYGGLNWQGILDFIKRAARGAIDIGRVAVPVLAPQYAPIVEGVHRVAEAVGVGRRPRGSALLGGKALPRSKMISMMRH